MADQITIFDLIQDAPPADGVTVRIKYADRSNPTKKGSVRINTTRQKYAEDIRNWREENKAKFYFLGTEEV